MKKAIEINKRSFIGIVLKSIKLTLNKKKRGLCVVVCKKRRFRLRSFLNR